MKRGAGSTSVRKSSTGGGWGWGPADTGGEYAAWRPSEVEEATRGIATCGASVSARPEGGGSTRVRRPTTPPRDTMAGAPRREALRVTTGPLAPSRGDQVVNHVIVVGRHVPPGEAERRPGSRDARGWSPRGRGRRRALAARRRRHRRAICAAGTLICQAEGIYCAASGQ